MSVVTLAYHASASPEADTLAEHLGSVGYVVERLVCEADEAPLSTRLLRSEDPLLLFINDGLLHSLHCQIGLLDAYGQLSTRHYFRPVMASTVREGPAGGSARVMTSLARVSDVIRYINYWQSAYLTRRRELGSAAGTTGAEELAVLRRVSQEIGEVLKLIRAARPTDVRALSTTDAGQLAKMLGPPGHSEGPIYGDDVSDAGAGEGAPFPVVLPDAEEASAKTEAEATPSPPAASETLDGATLQGSREATSEMEVLSPARGRESRGELTDTLKTQPDTAFANARDSHSATHKPASLRPPANSTVKALKKEVSLPTDKSGTMDTLGEDDTASSDGQETAPSSSGAPILSGPEDNAESLASQAPSGEDVTADTSTTPDERTSPPPPPTGDVEARNKAFSPLLAEESTTVGQAVQTDAPRTNSDSTTELPRAEATADGLSIEPKRNAKGDGFDAVSVPDEAASTSIPTPAPDRPASPSTYGLPEVDGVDMQPASEIARNEQSETEPSGLISGIASESEAAYPPLYDVANVGADANSGVAASLPAGNTPTTRVESVDDDGQVVAGSSSRAPRRNEVKNAPHPPVSTPRQLNEEHLRELERKASKLTRARNLRTFLAHRERDGLNAAAEFAHAALDEDPRDHKLRYAFAVTLLEHAEQTDETVEELRAVFAPLLDSPLAALAHLCLGQLALRRRDFGSGRLHLQKAYDLDKDVDPELSYRLGALLQDEYEDAGPRAVKYLRRASKRSLVNRADANYRLGLLDWQAGRRRRAMKRLKLALKLEPEHPFAAYDLAVVLRERNRPIKARSYFQRAVRANPELDTETNRSAFTPVDADGAPTRLPETQTEKFFDFVRDRSSGRDKEALSGRSVYAIGEAERDVDEDGSSTPESSVPLEGAAKVQSDKGQPHAVSLGSGTGGGNTREPSDAPKIDSLSPPQIDPHEQHQDNKGECSEISKPASTPHETIDDHSGAAPPAAPLQTDGTAATVLKAAAASIQAAIQAVRDEAIALGDLAARVATPRRRLTVLITGASSGIGLATARCFAEAGHRLILTGRRVDRLIALSNELKGEHKVAVRLLSFDVADFETAQRMVGSLEGEWANVDVLVNNAGKARGLKPIYEMEADEMDDMVDTNVKGLLYMTRLVGADMVERGGGHIINVCSTAGHEVYAGGTVYCATKHAVDAITRGTRLDMFRRGIRVSQVSPAAVEETEFSEVRFDGDSARAASVYEGWQPLRATDVAEQVLAIAMAPAHVNVQDVIMLGTQQGNSTSVNKSGRA